jgi:uncharacterized protein (TIRG00374 family)
MKKTLVTILQYVVFLGLGIWIIYHMLHELKPEQKDQLLNAIASVNLWYLVPIFFLGFLSHLFRAMRWRLLLETLKGHPHPSLFNTTAAVLVGYITNLVLPRAGEVAKCTVLAKYEKTPAHKMVGTIVAERAFDILCLIIVAVIAGLLQASVIGTFAREMAHKVARGFMRSEHTLLIILIVIIILVIAVILVYRRHRETQVGHFMREMAHGIASIYHMKKRWQFLGYTFLIWAMYTLEIYVGFMALPATAQHLGFLALPAFPGHNINMYAALVVLVYGAVGMIITPGGIGAYTLLVGQMLTYYAIDDVNAQAFGWIAWAAQTGIIILLGIAALIFLPLHNQRRNRHAQATVDTE